MPPSSPPSTAARGRSGSEPRAELARMLGDEPPAELADVPDAAVADLVAAIRDAQRRQVRTLLDAREAALRQVPWPLRGIVRKTLS